MASSSSSTTAPLAVATGPSSSPPDATDQNPKRMPSGHRVVVVHGGAWSMPDYFIESYTAGVEAAAVQGYRRLVKDGGPVSLSDRIAAQGGAVASVSRAVQAVEAAVETMENTPIFNAGTGSSLTADGRVEMDAFIMDGRTLAVGAVCNMKAARNAVSVARIVMEHSRHCLLAGKGADGFATHMGANLATQAELKTEQAQLKLLAARHRVSYPRMLETAASHAANTAQAAADTAQAAADTANGIVPALATGAGAGAGANTLANALDNVNGASSGAANMPTARLMAQAGVVLARPIATAASVRAGVAAKANAAAAVAAGKPPPRRSGRKQRTMLPAGTIQAVLNTAVGSSVATRLIRRRDKRQERAAATAAKAASARARGTKRRSTSASAKRTGGGGGATAADAPSSSVSPPVKRQRKGKGKGKARRASKALAAAVADEDAGLTPTGPAAALGNGTELPATEMPMDTVGAVALDADGHVAAATSTGGTTNKAPGRVGDSPLTGSGGYADDEVGAVSTTGQGEAIMRICLAMNAINRVRSGNTPTQACRQSLEYMRKRVKGVGGLIMVTPSGEWVARCSTSRMAWACVADGVLYSGVSNGSSLPPEAGEEELPASKDGDIDASALS